MIHLWNSVLIHATSFWHLFSGLKVKGLPSYYGDTSAKYGGEPVGDALSQIGGTSTGTHTLTPFPGYKAGNITLHLRIQADKI